mmetsp:Transcript_11962/g.21195  ORF Transcript_11962/g.21195 Transcript_11962/m.21195 type:complete len:260 (+) Transcript_11962:783-1562(+)
MHPRVPHRRLGEQRLRVGRHVRRMADGGFGRRRAHARLERSQVREQRRRERRVLVHVALPRQVVPLPRLDLERAELVVEPQAHGLRRGPLRRVGPREPDRERYDRPVERQQDEPARRVLAVPLACGGAPLHDEGGQVRGRQRERGAGGHRVGGRRAVGTSDLVQGGRGDGEGDAAHRRQPVVVREGETRDHGHASVRLDRLETPPSAGRTAQTKRRADGAQGLPLGAAVGRGAAPRASASSAGGDVRAHGRAPQTRAPE